jgi:hypothetical protein
MQVPCKVVSSTSQAAPAEPAATTSDMEENVLHVCKIKSPKNKKAHRKGGQLNHVYDLDPTRRLAHPRKGSATTGDGGSRIHCEAKKGCGLRKGKWREAKF